MKRDNVATYGALGSIYERIEEIKFDINDITFTIEEI